MSDPVSGLLAGNVLIVRFVSLVFCVLSGCTCDCADICSNSTQDRLQLCLSRAYLERRRQVSKLVLSDCHVSRCHVPHVLPCPAGLHCCPLFCLPCCPALRFREMQPLCCFSPLEIWRLLGSLSVDVLMLMLAMWPWANVACRVFAGLEASELARLSMIDAS